MTPLNSILANSAIVYKRMKDFFQKQIEELIKLGKNKEAEVLSKKNEETLKLQKNIQ